MLEFSLASYRKILESFRNSGYHFMPFEDFLLSGLDNKTVILRHDVDRYPKNALKMARMENEMGIRSTYFFRTIPSVYKEDIMKAVAGLGHEVAYHYEDLSKAGGNRVKAIKRFEENLTRIRKIYPARTICMHGSPLSKWDNKTIWEDYNYRDYEIIGDTSLDIDYAQVFYITDNGWGWNNTATSIRDKVTSRFNIPISNTEHFIKLILNKKLPDKILFNTHPDTFFDFGFKYMLNWSLIRAKNTVKRIIVKYGLRK